MIDPTHLTRPAARIDANGLACPLPLVELQHRLLALDAGETVEFLADDPAAEDDLLAWSQATGHRILALRAGLHQGIVAIVQKTARGAGSA